MRMKCGACGHLWRWQAAGEAAGDALAQDPAPRNPEPADPAPRDPATAAPSGEDEAASRESSSADDDGDGPDGLDLPRVVVDDDDDDDMPVPPRILDDEEGEGGRDDDGEAAGRVAERGDSAGDVAADAEDVLRRLRERNRGRAARPSVVRRNAGRGEDVARRMLLIAGWGAWAAFVATLVVVVAFFPDRAVRLYPPLDRLYRAVGVEVHAGAADRGGAEASSQALAVVIDASPEWRPRAAGGYDLVISGRVVNRGRTSARLPPVLVALVSEDGGRVLRRRRIEPSVRSLGPGGEVVFQAVIEDAPTSPARIVARLADGTGDAAGGGGGDGAHSRR